MSWEQDGWGGMWGGVPANNNDFNDILSVFSSFHMIIDKVLSFSVIFQHNLRFFGYFVAFFAPPLATPLLAGHQPDLRGHSSNLARSVQEGRDNAEPTSSHSNSSRLHSYLQRKISSHRVYK